MNLSFIKKYLKKIQFDYIIFDIKILLFLEQASSMSANLLIIEGREEDGN
jgi:hypothetical protein